MPLFADMLSIAASHYEIENIGKCVRKKIDTDFFKIILCPDAFLEHRDEVKAGFLGADTISFEIADIYRLFRLDTKLHQRPLEDPWIGFCVLQVAAMVDLLEPFGQSIFTLQ